MLWSWNRTQASLQGSQDWPQREEPATLTGDGETRGWRGRRDSFRTLLMAPDAGMIALFREAEGFLENAQHRLQP